MLAAASGFWGVGSRFVFWFFGAYTRLADYAHRHFSEDLRFGTFPACPRMSVDVHLCVTAGFSSQSPKRPRVLSAHHCRPVFCFLRLSPCI